MGIFPTGPSPLSNTEGSRLRTRVIGEVDSRNTQDHTSPPQGVQGYNQLVIYIHHTQVSGYPPPLHEQETDAALRNFVQPTLSSFRPDQALHSPLPGAFIVYRRRRLHVGPASSGAWLRDPQWFRAVSSMS